jgi:hypothetical protein
MVAKEEGVNVGHVDCDKELQHWGERKPRVMKQMRVDIRVLVEDHKAWHQGNLDLRLKACRSVGDIFLFL